MSNDISGKRVKQSFIKGASILMGAMFICKILGFVYRIPITRLLGGLGNGYFSTAYLLFTPFFALSISGLTAAIARLVAEQSECKRWNDVRRLKKVSKRVFWIVAFLAFIMIVSLAWVFVNYISPNPKALWSVYAIAPAALFGIASASYRGYYEGICNMTPTAVSQIIENIIKIGVGLGLMYAIYYIGYAQVSAGGSFLGITTTVKAEYDIAIAPFAIAGSLLGVSISSFGSLVYLWFRDKMKGDGITRRELAQAPPPMRNSTLIIKLIRVAIPISIGSLVMNFTSLVDAVTVINRLFNVISNAPVEFISAYDGKLVIGTGLNAANDMATTVYGIYTGMALTISVLIPDMVSMLGKSSLPNVAAAWLARSRARIKYNIESLMRLTAIISVPAGIGMCVLAHPILTLIFSSGSPESNIKNEIDIAAPMLSMLAIAAILIAIVTPLFSVFQAIGRSDMPIKFMLSGAVVKLAANYFLVNIPSINIKGAPIGTLSCYSLIIILCFYFIPRVTGVRINYIGTIIKPLFSGGVCGLTSYMVYNFIPGGLAIKLGAAIVFGAVFYGIMLILLRTLSKEDILSLPNGKKIAKTLEKFNIIG